MQTDQVKNMKYTIMKLMSRIELIHHKKFDQLYPEKSEACWKAMESNCVEKMDEIITELNGLLKS